VRREQRQPPIGRFLNLTPAKFSALTSGAKNSQRNVLTTPERAGEQTRTIHEITQNRANKTVTLRVVSWLVVLRGGNLSAGRPKNLDFPNHAASLIMPNGK
jgi:hypothetical protein